MRRALFHARRGEGVTTPNPMVGAVVVTPDGVVVGQGRHPRAGEPHAEVFALDDAGERARGATLYRHLEPCCHIGRTGPVHAPHHRGRHSPRRGGDARSESAGQRQGLRRAARAAASQVEVGLLEDEAARLNRAFAIVQTEGRPMVIAKAATSLDSRIAAAPGVRTQLTSREANRRTQRLRASVDAIGVGSGTLLADDPVLTVRDCYRPRPLARVVFDRRLRTPRNARLFSTLDAGPVIILTTAAAAGRQPERAAGTDARRAPR